MRENKDERINRIINAAVNVLAAKGYDNATIADIADVAGISRGLPHYYFKDKEDLVIKALEASTSEMIRSSVSRLHGESIEQLVENIIEIHKENLQEHPAFYAFLFEMWSAGRRSKKIGSMFRQSQDDVVETLIKKLESTVKIASELTSEQLEALSRLIIALTDGTAFQLIIRPQKLSYEDALWQLFRKMLLAVFDTKNGSKRNK
ncbi:MAG: TetR/AcrR family transcriptional regulator [Thermoproteota archaeon]|jgi:AcrR family transcriptional regulator|nr:TetR/AcrR family transcriptional regulator [Thermoproteota archaeon]